MVEIGASLAVRQVARDISHSARPDAPLRPDDAPIAQLAGVVVARQRLSNALRRLADVVQPIGGGTALPLPASR